MKRVVIIGGGASGLMAALNIKDDYEIVILEKKGLAKKLLLTGAGRCNYWNSSITKDNYYSSNKGLLDSILTEENKDKVMAIFKELGIIPKIKNGYYYPSTESSQTFKTALLRKVLPKTIIKEDFLVTSIKNINDKFIISNGKENITCDKLVLATGSNASLKEKDYLSYNYLKERGHSIIPILPALVSLKIEDKYLNSLKGLRIDACISLYEDNKLLKKETGQLQLTANSLSGICIFNISSLASRGLYNKKKEVVKINFLPFIETDNYLECFNERDKLMKDATAMELFETVLHYKLVKTIFVKEKITKEKWSDLSLKEKEKIIKDFTEYEVTILETNSLEEAQSVTGGVSLKEINLKTMESLLVKNLYITGELLDADGICGGFNLAFAFITGYLAGKDI